MAKSRGRRLLTAGAFAAAVLIAVWACIISSDRYQRLHPPGYATGDTLNIRLYGITPAQSHDIVDVRGKKVAETSAGSRWAGFYAPGG